MGDLDRYCELRGRAAEGKGCTLIPNLRYCAKRSSTRQGRARDCTTITFENISEPGLLGLPPTFAKFPLLVDALKNGLRAPQLFIGDSLFAGWGSNGPGGGALQGQAGNAFYNRRRSSVVGLVADALTAFGIRHRSDAVFGWSTTLANTIAEQVAYNPDLALGAGWFSTANYCVGGSSFQNGSDATPITITPRSPADACDVYYPSAPTNNSAISVTDSDGALVGSPLNGAAAVGFRKSTTTRAVRSTKPISLARTGAGTNCPVTAIIPYDTTRPGLELWNAGWAGSTVANWNTTGRSESPATTLSVIGAKGVVICLGQNDFLTGVVAADYKTAYQTLIQNVMAGGPVPVLVKPGNAFNSNPAYNVPASYLTVIDQLVTQFNLPDPIDFSTIAYTSEDFFDNVHRTTPGYFKDMQRIMDGLR